MKTAWFPILSAAAMGLASLPAPAQMVISAKSGVVNFTQGTVLLDDKAVESSITKYPEMKENAVLRTEAGRAEVLLTPGTILRMGENTGLKMITNRLIDTRVELLSGSAVVETVQTAKDNNVTVVVHDGATSLTKAGIYRFDTSPGSVKVIRGEAAVEIDGRTTPISTGRMMRLDGSNVAVERFDSENTDALDHWSRQRSELLAMANPSTAKSLMSGVYTGYTGYPGSGYGYGYGYGGLYGGMGCSPFWGFSTWYAMYTYMPCDGYFISPYGFSYWSPRTVGRVFYTGLGHYRSLGGPSRFAYPGTGIRAGGYGLGGSRSRGTLGRVGSSRGSVGSVRGGSGAGSMAGHGGGTAGGHGSGGGGHGH